MGCASSVSVSPEFLQHTKFSTAPTDALLEGFVTRDKKTIVLEQEWIRSALTMAEIKRKLRRGRSAGGDAARAKMLKFLDADGVCCLQVQNRTFPYEQDSIQDELERTADRFGRTKSEGSQKAVTPVRAPGGNLIALIAVRHFGPQPLDRPVYCIVHGTRPRALGQAADSLSYEGCPLYPWAKVCKGASNSGATPFKNLHWDPIYLATAEGSYDSEPAFACHTSESGRALKIFHPNDPSCGLLVMRASPPGSTFEIAHGADVAFQLCLAIACVRLCDEYKNKGYYVGRYLPGLGGGA